jgi:hypothetical protein
VIIDKKDTSAIEEEKVSLVHDGETTEEANQEEEQLPKKGEEGQQEPVDSGFRALQNISDTK